MTHRRPQFRVETTLSARASQRPKPGPRFPYGRHLFDEREIEAAREALLDRRLSGGERTARFEEAFARLVGAPFACFVNSGSSANLLAAAALVAAEGENALRPGDEVVVPALSFPTTANAFLFQGLSIVLADVRRDTLTIDAATVEPCLGRRTRALSVLHTLGNPCEMESLLALARDRRLVVLEDACEALGTTWRGRAAGTFGALGTYSFYPAHQITTGEGGCVVGADPALVPALHSLRDWGRDCPCERCASAGKGDRRAPLPGDWDRHFLYTHRGFNLKALDLQAAIGLAQIEKFPRFRAARKANFARLRGWFAEREDLFAPTRTPPGGDPCWFAFPVVLREGRLSRPGLLRFLADRGVETRPLLAGNLARQPGFSGAKIRIPAPLPEAEHLVRNGFFVGLHPGLSSEDIDAMLRAFGDFVDRGGAARPDHLPAISRRRSMRRAATRSKE